MSKYLFQNYRAINADNYAALPEVFQKEMQHIGAFDDLIQTIEDLINSCSEEFPEDPDLNLFDVVNEENPEKVLYHFWHYLDEYGHLFFADSGKSADIGMMNFNFELHDGSPASIELAKELQDSYYND